MTEANKVRWSRRAEKSISRLPGNIARKFFAWVVTVQMAGIRETRRRPGFHDEPLTGNRKGQRSVRLNLHFRVIYIEMSDGSNEWLEVLEVTNHEY